jgi:uncharacterized coiled-coil protein SlyX
MMDWATVVASVVLAAIPALVAYGALKATVTHLREDCSRMASELKALSNALVDLRVDLAETTGTHRLPPPGR